MIILPAIDIKGGECVRLVKGDYSTAQKVIESPYLAAQRFADAGANWMHMVDLDGSLKKKPVNADTFVSVATETPLKVEVGGGIRTMNDIDFYAQKGISRVILGSVALKNPDLVAEACKEFGSLVAVGIDAKNGYAATEGWTESSDIYFVDLARRMEDMGVRTIIYTDIGRDGTLTGPNVSQLTELNDAVTCDIIASGGVTNIDDIKELKNNNLYGAICGKSIYKGTLDLADAIEVCND